MSGVSHMTRQEEIQELWGGGEDKALGGEKVTSAHGHEQENEGGAQRCADASVKPHSNPAKM